MIDISGHLRRYKQESGFETKDSYITINCCGYQKFNTMDFTRIREIGRLDYQIIYINKGKGHFKLNGEFIAVDEGNIVIYKPHEPQHYTYYSKENPEVYWIHFSGYGVKELLSMSGIHKQNVFYVGISNTCIDLYKKIIYELQIKRDMYDKMASAYFMELVSQFSRRVIENNKGLNKAGDKNLQRVIENMHSCYNRKCTVNEFAVLCNLSVYRFIHNFKALTGMAPMEYITAIRIDKAKELLNSSSLNISEISDVVGYDNPLYFSRMFKKIIGTSPTNYRKSIP